MKEGGLGKMIFVGDKWKILGGKNASCGTSGWQSCSLSLETDSDCVGCSSRAVQNFKPPAAGARGRHQFVITIAMTTASHHHRGGPLSRRSAGASNAGCGGR